MAIKSFNRTVEAINVLLDKLDGLPTYPMCYKDEVLEYTDLPEEPAQGDCYLVSFETNTDHVANKLYYYNGTTWKEIAVDGYTKYEIETMLAAITASAKLTGYAIDTSATIPAITADNTINQAVGILEHKANDNKTNILSVSAYIVPEIPSGNLTDSNVERDYNCRIVGYAMNTDLAGRGGWVYVDTIILNIEGSRRMQKSYFSDGVTKTRFYGANGWESWA